MQHDRDCKAWILGNDACNCSATTEMYYINDSRTYVGNCMLWWRKEGAGYTTNIKEAWKVPKWKALNLTRDRKTDIMYLAEMIESVATLTVDMQRIH